MSFLARTWEALFHLNLVVKLWILRSKLKWWNLKFFEDLNTKAKTIQSHIDDFEVLVEQRDLTRLESASLRSLQFNFFEAQKKIDSLWCQNLRVQWYLQGDHNTRFFQTMAACHFRNNHISQVKLNGTVFSNLIDVKNVAKEYFANLFKQHSAC